MTNDYEQEIATRRARREAEDREIKRLEQARQKQLIESPVPTKTVTMVVPEPITCQECAKQPAATKQDERTETAWGRHGNSYPVQRKVEGSFHYSIVEKGKILCEGCYQKVLEDWRRRDSTIAAWSEMR